MNISRPGGRGGRRCIVVTSLVAALAGAGCTDSVDAPDMAFVGGGELMLGCTAEQAAICLSDETSVEVSLEDFWISKFEVTTAEFATFLNARGNQVEGDAPWYRIDEYALLSDSAGRFVPKPGFEDYPITNVTWFAARAYAAWLSERTGDVYRLPTEAQWEFAARAGQGAEQQTLYSGSDDVEKVAWCDDFSAESGTGWGFRNDKGVHPVGTKSPNSLGIYDLSGNAREWTRDFYDNRLEGGSDPLGATSGSLRVSRGGSFDNAIEDCRVSARGKNEHVSRFAVSDGFRLIREEGRR